MTNKNGSGCCGKQEAAKADEQAAITSQHEKGGCGCEGEERKVEVRGTETVVAQAAIAEPTKTERKQGCC